MENDREVWGYIHQLFEYQPAIQIGKSNIQKNGTIMLVLHEIHGFGASGHHVHSVPLIFKEIVQDNVDIRIVFYRKNSCLLTYDRCINHDHKKGTGSSLSDSQSPVGSYKIKKHYTEDQQFLGQR